MKYLVIIPARSGSTRLKDKNIKLISGKPLIAHTILHAKSCPKVDRIIVSTDSNEYTDIAKNWGAEVPFKRPAQISDAHASTESVLIHALGELEKEGYVPDAVILMQATSPIRRPGALQRAIEKFEKDQADSLMTALPVGFFLWRNIDAPYSIYDYKARPRTQDIKEADKHFQENGNIYITKTQLLLKEKNRLGGKISISLMDELETLEIDTLEDFEKIEAIMKVFNF